MLIVMNYFPTLFFSWENVTCEIVRKRILNCICYCSVLKCLFYELLGLVVGWAGVREHDSTYSQNIYRSRSTCVSQTEFTNGFLLTFLTV